MNISYETNSFGERVKVTRIGDVVIRELDLPPPAVTQRNRYTIAQFIEALTRPEALNFLATMKTDPLLEMWYELAKARGGVDFNDADTYDNAPYLVQAGVLTQERLDAITG